MSQTSKIAVAVVITIIVAGGGVYLWQKQTAPATNLAGQTGFIVGPISGPPRGGCMEEPCPPPPEFQVCAENINSQKLYCMSQPEGTKYRLEVPTGYYYVFTKDNNSDRKAYYSEFITCGLRADCKSHKPIVVKVGTGVTVENIDPYDWY